MTNNSGKSGGAQRTLPQHREGGPHIGVSLSLCSLATTRTRSAATARANNDNGNGNGGNGNGANCFLKGTKIQTVEGERKVEDLAIGDLLPTMFGGLASRSMDRDAIQSGGVIRRSLGSRTRCQFASKPVPLSLPTSRVPISM